LVPAHAAQLWITNTPAGSGQGDTLHAAFGKVNTNFTYLFNNASYSPPTGTGFPHITAGVQDSASKLIDTADINNSQVTYGKIQNVSATDLLLGRASVGAGIVEEIPLTSFGRLLLAAASTAAQRTALGLTIGTDVQAYNAHLQTLSGISSNGILARTSAGEVRSLQLLSGYGITVTNGFGSNGLNPAFGINLEAGTNIVLTSNGLAIVINNSANPSGSYTPPTGTGFPHITAGVQDSASKLVDTADINNLQVTSGKLASGIDAAKIGGGGVSTTEFDFLGTVTSDVQAQINLKAPSLSPTLTTPILGVATATSINKVAITQPATSATLTIADGKTLTANNSLTLAGTDATTQTFPATSGTVLTSVSKANEVQAGFLAADAGSTDDYVITLTPAITAYSAGTHYYFSANTANTGAATLNINGIGVKNIAKVSVTGGSNTTLEDGDIQAGQWVDVVYTGIRFQMVSRLGAQHFKSYLKFNYPRRIDGAGVTIPNTNDFTLPTFMIPRFSGTAATNANYVRFGVRVPKDFDVNVVPTANLTVRLTAADTAAQIYNVGFASVANSAVSAATAGTWIKLDVAADASGSSDDVESVSSVALTGWNSGSTAGQWWVIELNRDGATDASTVASELLELEIQYGAVQ